MMVPNKSVRLYRTGGNPDASLFVPSHMSRKRKISLYLMAALYIGAGIMHFIKPPMYERIMPPYLPWHSTLVLLSGICEVLLGVLLLFPSTRRVAAWGIIALLVAVFPANIQMAINYYQQQHALLWIALLRLPLQLVLIRWAYKFARRSG